MAQKGQMNVVEILDSSDEDEPRRLIQPKKEQSINSATHSTSSEGSANSNSAKLRLESRSFWKAGDFAVGPTKFTPSEGPLEHARVHPKFLHSNATSHKWAFGAIAELLDNAVDEIKHGATFIKVDKILNPRDNCPALLFLDDGAGMDPSGLRKCMGLGYSSKTDNTTIGQYGNGFKTSTMRLGADVIVFSRSLVSGKATQSIGLLSYTFLRKTGKDDVIVPMVDFDICNNRVEPIISHLQSQDDWSQNLKTILDWSPFGSKEELMAQFNDIGPHGTKILIYNLWLNDEGVYELSLDDDDEDIRLRDETSNNSLLKVSKKALELQSHFSYRLRFSLRAYASLLYMRKLKNFKIILRGKPVKQLYITDWAKHLTTVNYKPQLSSSDEVVKTTIGFINEAPHLKVSGFNVYHKNRLIKYFWKVTIDGNSKGDGVVGALEVNFIHPAHDKQDFERSSLFLKLESRLKQMVMEYWRGHCHLVGHPVWGTRKEQPVTATPPAKAQQQSNEVPVTLSAPNLPLNGSAAGLNQVIPPPDDLSPLSVDQIRAENIQLFIKCEGYTKQENELRQTVSKLEKELVETKKKCDQLAAYLESRKRQLEQQP